MDYEEETTTETLGPQPEDVATSSKYQEELEEFLQSRYSSEIDALATHYPEQKSLVIEYNDLDEYNPEIAEMLIKDPYRIITLAKKALEAQKPMMSLERTFKPNVMFKSLPEEYEFSIKDLNSSLINKLVSFEGTVKKITEVKPRLVKAIFECVHCNKIHQIKQNYKNNKLGKPSKCVACNRKSFELLEEDSEFLDTQKVEFQEPIENMRGKEQAKPITAWIQDDLTNKLTPGDKVGITGVLRIAESKKKGSIYNKYVDINHLYKKQTEFEDLELTEEDIEEVKKLSNDPLIYEKIVGSIAPSIYGYEDIKEAIALQLFGGTQGKEKPDGMHIRPDIHILLIGDPGCITGDSYVVTSKGEFKKMKNFGSEHLEKIDYRVLVDRESSKENPYGDCKRFHKYIAPTLEIKTETGKKVTCTHNHKFKVREKERGKRSLRTKWKRADEIKEGNEIKSMSKIPSTIKNYKKINAKEVTEDLALLYGYMLGDGWVRKRGYRSGFVVNEEEKDIEKKLVNITKNRLNYTPKRYERKPKTGEIEGRKIERNQKLIYNEINSKEIGKFFKGVKNHEIPEEIMASKNSVISEFLKGLFEADGCVFSKGRGKRAIQLKSKNQELLRHTQLLLMRFGIKAWINGDNLAIRKKPDMLKFIKEVGFLSEKKKQKTKKLKKDLGEIKAQRKSWYEEVVSIRPKGIQKVYDIEVKEKERYIANGIVNHNTAKSQLLQYVEGLSPKGIYVSGKSSSAAGLTATAEKDEFGEEGWTLKAGALVLAAGGMALVDELDKIGKEDRSSLHQAMESQRISVAKAGIVTTFKANAAILAAANPKYGRFDKYELPAEQFNIPPTLMSRFDLMFPVKDEPNREKDKALARHILITHRVSGTRARGRKLEAEKEEEEKRTLPDIEPDLLRKYISYARRHIRPVLTDEAEERIRDFYIDLRKVGESQDSIPITARQLETIIRLSEASAKGRLSDRVEIEDAERAIRLQKTCMQEVGVDPETGNFDIDIIATGSSKSKMNRMKTVIKIIKNLNKEYDEAGYEAIKDEAKEKGVDKEELGDILKDLKKNGDVYTPAYGVYKPTEE